MSSSYKVHHRNRHKRMVPVNVGDIVALTLPIVRDGVEIDRKVAVVGRVTRIWQASGGRRWWRADIETSKPGLWALYSGKSGWAWLNELTLLRRAPRKP